MKAEIDKVKKLHEKLRYAIKTAINNMYKIWTINKSISSFSCDDCPHNKQVKSYLSHCMPKDNRTRRTYTL
jgi:hypothetical protein